MSFHPNQLIENLRSLPAASRYWVAYSGGLDSSVLLHALAGDRKALPGELRALHVHHGLHPLASEWRRHCEEVCAGLGVPLDSRRVRVMPAAGESLEAVARELRYGVFQSLLASDDLLLLAQHADDQLETFLLQALRGAGVRGLASMPAKAELFHAHLARPLLQYNRVELEDWARHMGFTWIEDPSNLDTSLDRNYLRREVLPALRRRWPSAAITLSRSAAHCAEAEQLLMELAAADWQACGGEVTLPVKTLLGLGGARARNLLRRWLALQGLNLPPTHKLEEILAQASAGADRNPCIEWSGVEVRRYRGRLHALRPLPEAPAEFTLQPAKAHALGAGLGHLLLAPAWGEGVRAALCSEAGLQVRFRSGGELCRPAGRAHHRPLKKWLQDMHVPPWLRDRLPMLYRDGELLAVAGLFTCAEYTAAPGEAGLRIEWLEHPQLA